MTMEYHNYSFLVLACLLFLFIVNRIFVSVKQHLFARNHGCKAPARMPQAERILGYSFFKTQVAAAAEKRSLLEMLSYFPKLGNTFSVTILGNKYVITIEPENVKAILATNFHDFGLGNRIETMGALLGQGIFTSDGSMWEHSRALVRPSFSKTQVADLENLETHIQHLISRIPLDGSPFDLQKLFFQFTLDTATEFLLGESVETLLSPEGSMQQLFGQAFDYAQLKLTDRNRLGPFFVKFYRNTEFDRACKVVHSFIDEFVLKALEYRRRQQSREKTTEENSRGKYIFMNELAMATEDPTQIRSELLNILLAGRDTTAGILSNSFHVLARKPEIWKKLKGEVNELEGKLPDYETLRNMKYLKAVLNEALRLYPSVPANERVATRNTTIPIGGGPDGKSSIFIAKGTRVAYFTFSMHRRKDIFGEDADEFNPERWEGLRAGWGYLPFNGGPRICVGQQFALTEAGYTIVRLLQKFRHIENRDPRGWVEGLHLTLSSGNGVHVAMIPE